MILKNLLKKFYQKILNIIYFNILGQNINIFLLQSFLASPRITIALKLLCTQSMLLLGTVYAVVRYSTVYATQFAKQDLCRIRMVIEIAGIPQVLQSFNPARMPKIHP